MAIFTYKRDWFDRKYGLVSKYHIGMNYSVVFYIIGILNLGLSLMFFYPNLKISGPNSAVIMFLSQQIPLIFMLLRLNVFDDENCRVQKEDEMGNIHYENTLGYHYYMGSVNGGRTDDFLALARTCNQHIKEDLKRGIVAKYHDESHLNHYLRYHDCTPLSPAYAYIEGKELPFEPKILLLDKVLIDPYFNKGRDHSLAGRFKKGMGIVIDAIKWYL